MRNQSKYQWALIDRIITFGIDRPTVSVFCLTPDAQRIQDEVSDVDEKLVLGTR